MSLKEAGLRKLALTNRNWIQRLIAEGKQTHLCETHGQQTAISRFSRCQWKERCLTWGGLEPYGLRIEKSAEPIVVGRTWASENRRVLTSQWRGERIVKWKFDKEPSCSLILEVAESTTGVKSGSVCFTNRRIREPYVRWSCLHFISADKCERRTPANYGRGRLLDWGALKSREVSVNFLSM